jgi:hypothetical protein
MGVVIVIGASEGGFIINRPIAEGGRDDETDYQQSDTNRLTEHPAIRILPISVF